MKKSRNKIIKEIGNSNDRQWFVCTSRKMIQKQHYQREKTAKIILMIAWILFILTLVLVFPFAFILLGIAVLIISILGILFIIALIPFIILYSICKAMNEVIM